jgi:hypothetical protein
MSQRRSDYLCPWGAFALFFHVNYDGSAGVPGRGHTHLCAAAMHLADNGRQRQLVPL